MHIDIAASPLRILRRARSELTVHPSPCKKFLPADLDGDGRLDLVTANDVGSFARLYHGEGNGSFTFVQPLLVNTQMMQSVVIFDADRDQRLDVLASSRANSVLRFLRNSSQ